MAQTDFGGYDSGQSPPMVVATPRWEGLGTRPISIFVTSQGDRPHHVVLWSPVLGIGIVLKHQVGSFGCSDSDNS